jgi:aspartyl/asparaginyl-tRNA synthetase
MDTSALIVDSVKFSFVANKLRDFFLKEKGFIEVHTQNRLSILAACEDVATISTFNFADIKFPLPQTGQMWLEKELLDRPDANGYFCVSTSYRNEPNPIPGRHDRIFPMFEFELKGGIDALQKLEQELLEFLGYGASDSFPEGDYEDVAKKYGTSDIEHHHEQMMYHEGKPAFFLKNFPEHTSPFWNMRRNEVKKTANKIDVILSGMETIGSAERSSDIADMSHRFHTISKGMYAKTLYNHFGKERVEEELQAFFQLKFIERSGGGIGITRLIKSMELEGLIPGTAQHVAKKAKIVP